MIDSQVLKEKINVLTEDKQEEIMDFVNFLAEQEKKSILHAQLNTSFAKEWLTDPAEDIYND